MIQLLPASIKDYKDLTRLEGISFPIDRWGLFDLVGVLTFRNVVRLKALYEGKFAGFTAGDIRKRDGVGWIVTIAVFPEFRGQGIGKALLDECESQMQMPVIKLTVRKSNYSAINLYLKNGYFQSEIWENYYIGGEDGILFEKHC
jgi:ribosomal-protein-alanine N-acetyltransferase